MIISCSLTTLVLYGRYVAFRQDWSVSHASLKVEATCLQQLAGEGRVKLHFSAKQKGQNSGFCKNMFVHRRDNCVFAAAQLVASPVKVAASTRTKLRMRWAPHFLQTSSTSLALPTLYCPLALTTCIALLCLFTSPQVLIVQSFISWAFDQR